MTDRRRAARIVAEWRRRRETGAEESPAELLRAHPDLAGEIRRHLEVQRRLEAIAPEQAPASPMPPTPLRERIGDFRILREIGRGGMGVVYEAEQVSMRRPVALKVLFPSVILDPKAVERFRREAQAAGRLHHTNIVAVHGMGEEDGVWFYAMERILGRTLAAVIADLKRLGGRPPAAPTATDPSSWITTGGTGRAFWARAATAFAGLADALDHAHAAGIVHRDVKPSNVMLDAEGTLKLTDFGLARVEEGGAALTMTGDLLGTPAYMSPEQIRPGLQPLDARTDIYSLGATLYEFLALRPPFQGATSQDVLARILTEDPSPVRRWSPRIPRDLETIVSKAMERDPVRRYASAGDLARDLRFFADGAAIRARRTGVVGRTWRRVRRNKVRAAAVALAVIAIGTSVAWVTAASKEHERQRAMEYQALVQQIWERDILRSTLTSGLSFESDADVSAERLLDFERAIALDPDRPDAYLARSGCASRSRDERLADLDRARSLGGVGPRTLRLLRAEIFRDTGRVAEAQTEQAAAGLLSPEDDPSGLMCEVRTALHGGDRKAALPLLTRLLGRTDAGDALRPSLLYARAKVREGEGDLAGALEDLAAARPMEGRLSLRLSVHIASVWRRLGQPDRGDALFRLVLETARTAGDFPSWKSVCSALEEAREHRWQAAASEEALREFPHDAGFLVCRAASIAFDDPAAARVLIDEAARIAPESRAVSGHRMEILANTGAYADAGEVAEAILRRSPGDVYATQVKGIALVLSGHSDEGLTLLHRSADADPTSHEAYCNLAQALKFSNRWPEAQAATERALELDPLCPLARLMKSGLLLSAGRGADALIEAEKVLATNPRFAPGHTAKAGALLALGRAEEACREFDVAVELGPRDPNARLARATSLWGQKRYVEALRDVDEALRLRPGDPAATENRLLCLNQLERWEDVVRGVRERIDRGPTPFYGEATRALLALDRPDEALRLLEEMDAKPWAYGDLSRERAVLLAHMGRGENALRAIGDGTSRFPGEAIYFSAAKEVVLRILGRVEDARIVVRELLAAKTAFDPTTRACFTAFAGDRDGARAMLSQLATPKTGDDAYTRACLHALLGEADAAIHWLDLAVQGGKWEALPDPDFESIRQDPRFRPLERKLLGR